MRWLAAAQRLREAREAGVLVTLAAVRGHAPRAAGAKMVVSRDDAWDTIGGGNLEAVAVDRARELLDTAATTPESFTVRLSDRAAGPHGVQCCGGEVEVLLEPLPVVPAVAIFGLGHVGQELARVLARHDLDLHLVDTRAERLSDAALAPLTDAHARVLVHPVPVLPELVLASLPPGTFVLVMTHDHAEDAAIVDAALRTPALGPIGLIGSAGKWSRLRRRLLDAGLDQAEVDRVETPIGRPGLGKEPAAVAVGVAAELLARMGRLSRGSGEAAEQVGEACMRDQGSPSDGHSFTAPLETFMI